MNMIVILSVLESWVSIVLLYLLVSCLVVVENRKNGRMNRLVVRLVSSLGVSVVYCVDWKVSRMISVFLYRLLLKVLRNWVMNSGVKCWVFRSLN